MKTARALWAGAVAIGLAASLGACSSGGGDGGGAVPTSGENCKNTVEDGIPTVTIWAWYPQFDKVADAFNDRNDDVQVCWVDAGAGVDEYAKFAVTLEAGTGAPDIIMIEGDVIPGYVLRESFVDISSYGAEDVQDNYAEGTWNAATFGDGTYAIPVDIGPMGMFYREDIYNAFGVPVPGTWEEFAASAQTLQDAGAEGFLTNWQMNNAGFTIALLAQNGWVPFAFDTDTPDQIDVTIDTEEGREVLDYWFDLIDRGLVSADDRSTTDWQRNLTTGTYASYLAPAWGTKNIEGIEGADPAAQWRVAPLPQWDAANPVQTNWGGSYFAVTSQAPDAALATRAAIGLFDDTEAWNIGVNDLLFFPSYLPVLESEEFSQLSKPFYGDEKVNADVWVPAAQAVNTITFGPTQQFFNTVMAETLAEVRQGNIEPDQALAVMEDRVVADLETQGFTVG